MALLLRWAVAHVNWWLLMRYSTTIPNCFSQEKANIHTTTSDRLGLVWIRRPLNLCVSADSSPWLSYIFLMQTLLDVTQTEIVFLCLCVFSAIASHVVCIWFISCWMQGYIRVYIRMLRDFNTILRLRRKKIKAFVYKLTAPKVALYYVKIWNNVSAH